MNINLWGGLRIRGGNVFIEDNAVLLDSSFKAVAISRETVWQKVL